MQTNFSAEQRKDPEIAVAEDILRKCVHCGFCTATCPTYVLLGDELDSPRGRIYLIKDMLEQDRPATADVVQHLDRCLSCLACMTTCPSGVHYQHLIDQARAHVERTFVRPLLDRWLRRVLAALLPYPKRFRRALALGRLARPFAPLMPRRLRAMLALLPRPSARSGDAAEPLAGTAPTIHERNESGAAALGTPDVAAIKPRVAVFTGCVQSVLGASANSATVRLLERAGFEPVLLDVCCGSIVHHLGRSDDALTHAGALLERWSSLLEEGPVAALVVNASGCGTHLKDLGFVLRNEPELAEAAAVLSRKTRDITEFVTEAGLPGVCLQPGLKVAYHSACSMQHGQNLEREPRALLEAAGFEIAEIDEGHLCCGSAGTYNMLQPELAGRLRERKLENIERTGADLVAAGNLGCISQLGSRGRLNDLPVVHTVELLDWATGGPRPPALAGLDHRAEPRIQAPV